MDSRQGTRDQGAVETVCFSWRVFTEEDKSEFFLQQEHNNSFLRCKRNNLQEIASKHKNNQWRF